MSRHAVAHLDEIDEISDGRCPSRPIRHHFGITSFGVNAWTGREAGDRSSMSTTRARKTETRNSTSCTAAVPGSSSTMSRCRRRSARSSSSRPTSSARRSPRSRGRRCCHRRHTGEGVRAGGFEIWAPLGPLYEAGEYAEAADRGRERSRLTPSTRAALQRGVLRESCRTNDRRDRAPPARHRALYSCASLAANDSDFDPIRDDPAFKELIG